MYYINYSIIKLKIFKSCLITPLISLITTLINKILKLNSFYLLTPVLKYMALMATSYVV